MLQSAVLEGITDGLVTLDHNWSYTYVNLAAAAFFRTTPDDMVGKVIWERFPRLRDSRFHEEFTRAVEQQVFVKVQDFYEPLGRWCECRCYPTQDGLTVFFCDVADTKKVEEAMLESRQVLEMAITGSNSGIWRIDLNPEKPGYMPDYSYLSPQLKALIGFESDEFPNSRSAWLDRMPPADRARVEEAGKAHAEGQTEVYQVDFRIRHKDGSLRWFARRGRLYRDEFNRPIRWAGVDTDITDRTRMEQSLKEANKLLRARTKELQSVNEHLQAQTEELQTQREELQTQAEELRENEQALRQAHERAAWLARFPQENPSPVLRVSADDKVLYCNPAAARLPGWTCEVGESLPQAALSQLTREAATEDRVIERDVDVDGRPYAVAAIPVTEEHYVNIYGRDITERKRAEEALRKSENLRRLAEEITNVGAFEWNIVTGANTWTAELEALYGLPRGGFAGTQPAWEQLVHPEDRARATAAVQRAFESSDTIEDEWRVVWPDGSIHWLAGRFRVLRSEAGEPLALTGVNIDITERKHTEETVRRSRERFKVLSETASRLLTAENPQNAVRNLCGKIMEYLDCQVFFNFMADEKSGRLHLNASAGISKKQVREIEWLDDDVTVCGCVARDGKRFIAEDIPSHPDLRTDLVASCGIKAYACHPLLAGGKVIGTLSFGTKTRMRFSDEDLSLMKIVADEVAVAMERVRSQKALRESEGRMRRLNNQLEEEVQAQTEELRNTVDRLQDEVVRRVLAEGKLRKSGQMLEGFFQHTITPLAFMDRRFHFVRVNEAYARAAGKTPDFFKGKNHFALYPNDENQAIFEEVVRTGQPYRARAKAFTYPDRPQQVTYWDWQLTPVHDDRGETQYLVLNLQDATQQQATLRELEHRAFQLQKLTLELSQAEDRERRRLAEVLHDGLQQQLAAAKFHLGLLSSRAKIDAGMQEIAGQLDKMLRDAIEQSRSLSHELSPAVLYQSDLGETFEWLARQVQSKHGLVVHTEVHGRVDSQSESIKAFLFRAGQEILFNAVKHAKVAEARVRLQRRKGHLWLTIGDQGRGFDPNTVARAAGFGLLSIRERVGLLGGRMKIRSVPDRGSVFLIRVPDASIMEDREARAEEGGRKAERTKPHGHSSTAARPQVLRVLLVDDHKVMREGLAALIAEQKDMEIIGQAGNGREAVDLAQKLEPDVIIMDVAMPVMAGDEATRQVKILRPQTRVIALSMFEEPGVRERMLDAGAEIYLPKTGPAERFLAAIRGSDV